MIKVRHLFIILIIIGTGIVFYLSWLPDPDIGLLPYFPRGFGKWVNANGNLRTAIPFVFLGFVGEMFLVGGTASPLKRRLLLFFTLLSVVSLAEIGQMFLPYRHPDWGDIAWGALGTAVGILSGIIGSAILSERKIRN